MKKFLIVQVLLVAPLVFLFFKSDPNALNPNLVGQNQFMVQPHAHSNPPTENPADNKSPTPEPSPSPPTNSAGGSGDGSSKPDPDPKPEEHTPPPKTHTEEPDSNPGNVPKDNSGTSSTGSEADIKVIFKTEHQDNRCGEINKRTTLLCKLGFANNCQRHTISETLSNWWMVCPMYTANLDQTKHLYELHRNFRDYIHSYGINFQTVEVTFPGQEFQLTKPNNQPDDLQFTAQWIFAMRENLVNVGVHHLPDDWEFMSWIDQHIFWLDPYWFEKCIWLFSHHNIVHMLNGNDFWNLKNGTDYYLEGFGKLFNLYGMGFQSHDPRQCGLAWGMRREIFEGVGGLFDLCIGTKCDLYQNYAYAGSRYTSQASNGVYINKIAEWQDNAIRVYDRKLGYLDSKVVHFMHCYDNCQTSDYNAQVWALMRFNYDPDHDLERDAEGRLQFKDNFGLAQELWKLYGGAPKLRRR